MAITTHPNDIKERLSIAYVTAVAARAGCWVSEPTKDKQSIDATVRPINGLKISIEFQVKATSGECIDGEFVVHDISVKNYNDLRDEHCTAPHYLVVLVLDVDESRWLEANPDALLIRRCAYWLDLRGKPATPNRETIRVLLPLRQRFDVAAMVGMVQSAKAHIRPRLGGAT
jgi:hypothetical protein